MSDELDTATQRLLDEVRLLSEAELRAASLLPGWSRAHVLAHLARGADATRSLLIGARAGRDLPAYPGYQARDAAIDASAAAGAEDLKAAFGAMDLEEPMRSQRAERLEYVQPESVRAKSMARKIPAYQPGRPLPGSWIGKRGPG